MAYEVVMPQMGADMKEGAIVRWLKEEGEAVTRGEPIAEIDTDKATVELEAFESGVFRKILAQPGATVAVGQVIAIIAAPDEDISQYEALAPAPAAKKEPVPAAAVEPSPAPAPGGAPAAVERLRASPVVRRIAEEKGIDLRLIRGTGPEGRIIRQDIEAFLAHAATPAPEEAPAAEAAAVPVVMSRMRQTIARRMTQSKREAPHYYITMGIDMTEAQRLRSQLNAALGEEAHITVSDLLVKAAAKALARYPILNTWFVEEEIRQHEVQNVCIAIALEEGLIAPAILDCGKKTLAEIAQASRDLGERAKSGALKSEEYSGGTFTITNLGMFGVEELIAIIQSPQTAILGVGELRPTPVVREGEVVVAEVMKVALSADHRVSDGAQGAQFLGEIKRLLENPVSLLL